ncbi:YbaB/EbfC family nucleoid-associated protein [Candidatus Bipolaricaulota bacterium]|nr:YbaB/EbfC family nucleoid-associated protein [Candidatus Bipolaricaulota bacterium]
MRGFGDLRKLMQEAQRLQAEIAERQKRLDEARVEGSAGGGAVTAVVNGHGRVVEIHIRPDVLEGNDAEMLEDLLLSALQEAQRKAQELSRRVMGDLAPGLPGFGT